MADNNVEMAAVQPTGVSNQPTGVSNPRSRYTDLMYDPERDTAKEVRNAMLVVAALISAATFAAGINPPGGVWQDDGIKNSTIKYHSGKSVFATNSLAAYKVFIFANAAAFSSANLVIGYLVFGFPYYLEIWGAMLCMSLTYGISVGAVTPPEDTSYTKYQWFAFAFPYMLRAIAYLWKKCCA